MKIFHLNHVLEVRQAEAPSSSAEAVVKVSVPGGSGGPFARFLPGDQAGWRSLAHHHRASVHGELLVELSNGFGEAEFFRHYIAEFEPVDAAGGCVVDTHGALLMIFRKGLWDLPKGKVDPGETPPETAMREIPEETGVPYADIETELSPTHHIYKDKQLGWVLKTTYWYVMRAAGSPSLAPQAEEGITQALWVPLAEVPEKMRDTYPSIQQVVSEFLDICQR